MLLFAFLAFFFFAFSYCAALVKYIWEARTVVEKTVNSSNSVCRVYATNVTAASTSYFPSQRLPFLRPRNDDFKPRPSVNEQKASKNVTISKACTTVASESTIAENRRVLNEDIKRHISTVVPSGTSPPAQKKPHAQSSTLSPAAVSTAGLASASPPTKQYTNVQLLASTERAESREVNNDIRQETISTAPAARKSPLTVKSNPPPTPVRVEYTESDIEDRGTLQSACSREIARILSDFGGCESSDDLDGEEETRDEKYEVREEPRCNWQNTPKDQRFVEVGTPHGVRPLSPCQPVPRPNQTVVFPPPTPSYYPQSGAILSASPSLSHSSYEALETCAIRSKNFSKAHEFNDESHNATDTGNIQRTRSISNTSNDNNDEGEWLLSWEFYCGTSKIWTCEILIFLKIVNCFKTLFLIISCEQTDVRHIKLNNQHAPIPMTANVWDYHWQ